jgi:ubiquinone/menaquinone biosynthesis C-methylase UbiE
LTVDTEPGRETYYVLGRSAEEIERLQSQAAFIRPFTERLFRDAGIARGMKVLDLGSGAGDVALLAARLVGQEGTVLGIDTNPAILEVALARARAAQHRNVSFEAGDIRTLSLARDFDAVVGRYFLMFNSDPADTMREIVDHLRPGGIVAFQEPDFTQGPYAAPPSSLLDQIGRWITEAFRNSGARHRDGTQAPQSLPSSRAFRPSSGWRSIYWRRTGLGRLRPSSRPREECAALPGNVRDHNSKRSWA